IRFVRRFGILVVFVCAFLWGFGIKWLDQRLPAWSRRPLFAGVAVLLLLEYASFPLVYGSVTPVRPVDQVIRADPADAAVLELPTTVPALDADAMLGALAHGKYVVNGFAGFDDQWLIELSGLFTPSNESFPSPQAVAALRRIYPLRYLVIRLADPAMSRESRQAWLRLRAAPPPGLQFRGTFEDTDLYGVFPLPEQGARIERMASYTFLLSHPHLRLVAQPLTHSPNLEHRV